ncbi:MaoC/PaaZ C-terminal domain-containing protein [Nocardiopsis ansamitocini]|uniref:MaoC/PaaZ C-terminal domain-containing protein n=1 Tax=Nocardiopsis ansamitocini TaxID=1670832 RepID=UPI0025572AF3|nr:MaoC/PaaZ C-terminal domain-containing protein [Nocardiopsis ansamitocini]
MAVVRYFECFRVGDVHRLGAWAVTEQQIVEFATVFDPQPRHVDVDGGVVASGWHVAGIFMRLYVDALLSATAAEVSPGVEEMQWLAPVRPGAVLCGRVRVLGVQPSMSRPDCGVVHQCGELVDENSVPVLRVVFYGLIKRSPAL